MDKFILGEVGIRVNQFALNRLLANGIGVEAASVVREAQHDFAAFLGGGYGDLAGHGLAALAPLGLRLDTVIDAVADHVLEGTDYAFEHISIDFHIRAGEVRAPSGARCGANDRPASRRPPCAYA